MKRVLEAIRTLYLENDLFTIRCSDLDKNKMFTLHRASVGFYSAQDSYFSVEQLDELIDLLIDFQTSYNQVIDLKVENVLE